LEGLESRLAPASLLNGSLDLAAASLLQPNDGLASGSAVLVQPYNGVSSNDVQLPADTAFAAQVPDFQLAFGSAADATVGIIGGSDDSANGSLVGINLAGANPTPQTAGANQVVAADGTVQYDQLTYLGVYPGIDAVYSIPTQGQMVLDYVVNPGADPTSVVQTFSGVDNVQLDGQGNVILSTVAGDFLEQAPNAYQTINGVATDVPISYVVDNQGNVSFAVGTYDSTQPLVIDPGPQLPPQANNDSYQVKHDTTLTVSTPGVLGNDYSPSGNPLSAVLVSGPAHGSLSLNANGSFTYTPNTHFVGTDTWTYKDYDGSLYSNVATVTITVTNHVPTASNDTYNVLHDQTLTVAAPGVMANDYADADGDASSAVLVSTVSHGSLTLNGDGSFSYAPAAGYVGSDSFTYHDFDGIAYSNTATVSISVTNIVPVANNDTAQTTENQAVTVNVLSDAGDSDSDPLSVGSVTQPAHGTATINSDNTVTYAPSANFTGTDSFTYRASDGVSQSNAATITITVGPSSTGPHALNDSYTVVAGQTLSIGPNGVLANDIDPNGLALSAVLGTSTANGFLSLQSNGAFSYTPSGGFTGTDSFTYQASDGTYTSNTATVTITVTASGMDQVTAQNAQVSTGLNAPVSFNVLQSALDSNGNTLFVQSYTQPSNGRVTINASSGAATYTPNLNFTGQDSFSYVASDHSSTAIANVIITVLDGEWANSVVAYSSQRGSTPYGWLALQALGTPNTLSYGDFASAWAPGALNDGPQYLTLGYQTPVSPTGALIRETNGNGFVTQVDLLDTSGVYHTVWAGTDPSLPGSPADLVISFPQTSYQVNGVKVYVNGSYNTTTWAEIDAVELVSSSIVPAANVVPQAGSISVLTQGTAVNIPVLAHASDADGDDVSRCRG
jgi:hypothetical protein